MQKRTIRMCIATCQESYLLRICPRLAGTHPPQFLNQFFYSMAQHRASSCPLPEDRRVRPRIEMDVDNAVGEDAGPDIPAEPTSVISIELLDVNKMWSWVAETGERGWLCPRCFSRWLLIPVTSVELYHVGELVLEVAHHAGSRVNVDVPGDCGWCKVTWVARE